MSSKKVFQLVLQENTRKLEYQCPQKNLFRSVSGSRIFIDYSKPPNFSFFRAFPDTYIGLNLCILVNYTRKHPEIAISMSSKKVFWVRFGFLNFFRLLDELCILVIDTRKPPKVAVLMSSKKVFWVRFGFSNFFRLLETTEIFIFLVLFQRLILA